MGFVTSFLIIIFCGFWAYFLYHKFGIEKGHQAWIAWYAIIVVGSLMVLDVLIYSGLLDFLFPLLNQLNWVNIDNGRDFMWNSLHLLGIDWGIDYDDPGLIFIALTLVFSYPMWFKFFSNGSRMLFGGDKPYQQGLYYLLKPTKKPRAGDDTVAKAPKET